MLFRRRFWWWVLLEWLAIFIFAVSHFQNCLFPIHSIISITLHFMVFGTLSGHFSAADAKGEEAAQRLGILMSQSPQQKHTAHYVVYVSTPPLHSVLALSRHWIEMFMCWKRDECNIMGLCTPFHTAEKKCVLCAASTEGGGTVVRGSLIFLLSPASPFSPPSATLCPPVSSWVTV